MKFIAAVFVALAISAQADDHAHHTHDHYSPPVETYPSTSYSDSYYPTTSYDSPDVDMDVILPIVVFGGLGLGAIAYIESLNFRNRLCNKLRDVTGIARDAAANGNLMANLAEPAGNNVIQNEGNLNTIVNSNRLFINALAAIDNLDC